MVRNGNWRSTFRLHCCTRPCLKFGSIVVQSPRWLAGSTARLLTGNPVASVRTGVMLSLTNA